MAPKLFRARRRAFTLIELLVTIGIIALLVGITIPVVSRVRQSAQVANTQALIASMSNAIQQYYTEFSAYPGMFSNAQIIGGGLSVTGVSGNITMSENLVLSLMGGLNRTAFVAADVGKGAVSLSQYAIKQYPKYLDLPAEDLSQGDLGLGDSTIPEVMDRLANPRAILYLRAQVGADGVIAFAGKESDSSGTDLRAQYDMAQVAAYLNKPGDGLKTLGSGYKLEGLTAPYPALPYFSNQAIAPTDQSDAVSENRTGTPRQKDSYILISAGPDGIYGTDDDITNFGSIRP